MITPIHMQMVLPRSESVGNAQQFENQRVVNENTFAANQLAKEVKHNSETVIPKDANEFAEYQYDAKEEGNGTYSNPRKKKRPPKQEDELEEQDNASSINYSNDKQPRVNIQI